MSNFRVFPIPDAVARRVRETRSDDFGHRLSVSLATEGDTGPCRSCLTVFLPGEGRLLFSYAPNPCDHPYNESFPRELRTRRPLALRCYGEGGVMAGAELVGGRPVEEVIEGLFENPAVKYLHARTATVGCYIARIERA
jgi:hypothetical protein